MKDAPTKKREVKSAAKESDNDTRIMGNLTDFEEANESKNLVAY